MTGGIPVRWALKAEAALGALLALVTRVVRAGGVLGFVVGLGLVFLEWVVCLLWSKD